VAVLDRIQADVGRFGNSVLVIVGIAGVFIDFPERRSVSIFCVLGQDALHLCGIVGCFIPDDLDGHGCKVGLDGGKCAPVSEAHSNLAGSCVHCGDRYEYTEILDAGDERLVELRVRADVYVDEQAA